MRLRCVYSLSRLWCDQQCSTPASPSLKCHFRRTRRYLMPLSRTELAPFVRSEDREYFARPVPVEFVRKGGHGLVYVHDAVRGHTYPVRPEQLRREYELTLRQLFATI